ncbi:unnamed protein product [Allacma fusca]|uniref:Uncharacterized protein n=1 Tax=Allacma fusca TaxID=39272 RepID=A0A8J2P762_9HEXA|nr:unnamed protein product [Allacma fusca]
MTHFQSEKWEKDERCEKFMISQPLTYDYNMNGYMRTNKVLKTGKSDENPEAVAIVPKAAMMHGFKHKAI